MLNQEWTERMRQPPYGDRAITLKEGRKVIGAVRYVPCLAPFEQIPELRTAPQPTGYYTTEFGLFYAIDPQYQRKGYATEAECSSMRSSSYMSDAPLYDGLRERYAQTGNESRTQPPTGTTMVPDRRSIG